MSSILDQTARESWALPYIIPNRIGAVQFGVTVTKGIPVSWYWYIWKALIGKPNVVVPVYFLYREMTSWKSDGNVLELPGKGLPDRVKKLVLCSGNASAVSDCCVHLGSRRM